MKKYLFLITSFLAAFVASGATYYVVPGGAGSKNGTSWANAYADVQTAIDAAESAGGGEVWIAKGTYKHGSALVMKNNVAIYGGFAGTETSKDQRVAGNNTILDGEGKYRVFYNNYSSSNSLTNSAKLDNVTIQNGGTSDYGAGMYNYYASPEITNCTFTNNSAYLGGGMHNWDSSPKLTNCTFTGNSASSDGGGMYNLSSSPTLTNCTFSGNSASSQGGGMFNYGRSPKLTNCTFSGNRASWRGGGMFNYNSSSPKLTNCILWGNRSSYGNEIYNDDSNCKPTIDTCIIQNGKSGIYNSSYCTFTTEPITADPKLQPLADNGGSVQTIAVAEGSSAISAGKVVEGIYTDARGYVRSTDRTTIGAYEYNARTPTAYEKYVIENNLPNEMIDSSATPYNDGITNLEKFAFGLDASRATSYDANANFKHTSDATGATLEFPVSVDAEGVVNVKALKSTDLINWTNATATATGETSSDGKFKIYKATSPVGEDGKVFLKLKVEEK